ncbi:MAG: ribosome silencing factor [Pseudomonadota bacterium]|nr:ribosome silencing factor [Pseudomonadota bacterium]
MKKLTTPGKKKLVITALEDIKAHDILAIDVRAITPIFDWIVVASADSARQTNALARHVRDQLKEAGSVIVGTEGEATGEWILVDAGDVVAHVMQPAVRDYYNLEELWGEGKFDRVVNSTVPVTKEKAAPRKATKAKAAPRAVTKGKAAPRTVKKKAVGRTTRKKTAPRRKPG